MRRAEPSDMAHGHRGLPALAAMIDLGLWALVALVMMVIVPMQREVLADFGVELPWVSVAVLDTSEWLLGRAPGQVVPGIIWAGLMVGLLTLGTAMLFRARGVRALAWLVFLLWTAVPFVSLVVIVLAIFLPMTKMIESLQGGKM